MATTMSLSEAFHQVENGTAALAFSGLETSFNRERFVSALRNRIDEPYKIHQGNAPLCGPAAFMYCLARAYPDRYARYVLDLVTQGEAWLGSLQVKPSQACRQASPPVPDGRSRAIEMVDWVALASLRDSSNGWFRMNSIDSNLAGVTPGAMLANWFEQTGLFTAGNHSRNTSSASLEKLLSADQYFAMGHYVCLLIRAALIAPVGGEIGLNKLGRNTPKTILGTPDHWVVMQGPMRLGPQCFNPGSPSTVAALNAMKLEFPVYSWGTTYKINVRTANLAVNDLLPYFYGCVTARTA